MRVTLNIDNRIVTARAGMTVLEAAKKAGIYIPTLCDHDAVEPSGSCRLCIVKIKGMRGYPTACTTPVVDGMQVRTNTPRIRALRREIFTLTLSEHPYTCLVCSKKMNCEDYQGTIRKAGVTTGCHYCPKSGSCELQQLVDELGMKDVEFPIHYRCLPVEQEDPFFDRDYNLCILCGRCVRVCNDVRLNGTLTFGYRGNRTAVGTAFGKSHLDTGCEFCAACVDVCPTGALYDKLSKWEGCPEKSIQSLCPYCSVGCSLSYNLDGTTIVNTTPALNGTLNRGQVCVRGRFGPAQMAKHPDRLKIPKIRDGGRWQEATWDEALNHAAQGFSSFTGSAFACIVSPQISNEDAYVLRHLTREVMKSHHLANASVFAQDDYLEIVNALKASGSSMGTIEDIDRADAVVVWGADVSVTHPVVSLRIKQAAQSGSSLVVVDSRRTKLAERADLYLQIRTGMDRFLLACLLLRISERAGMPVSGRDWAKVEDALKTLAQSTVMKSAGISEAECERLVSMLVSAKRPLFLFGSGLILSEYTRENSRALADLVMTLKNGKWMAVAGESNLMGCLETGCFGLRVDEVIGGIEDGTIRCLYVVGDLPAFKGLEKLDFLVVQSVFPPEWIDKADVVFPAAMMDEGDGTMINFEGRIQRLRRVSRPAPQVKPDWWITARLASRIGNHTVPYRKTADIFEEMTSELSAFRNLALGKIGKKGRILRPDVKPDARRFFPFRIETNGEGSTGVYAYKLLLGWNIFGYRYGRFTETVPGMERILNPQGVEIHPEDAEKIGIQHGDRISLASRDGLRLNGVAEITDRIPRKTLYTPIGTNAGHRGGLFKKMSYSVKIEKGVYE